MDRSDTDADVRVEERVGEALRETDATLATAESCTGGLIGSMLTDVPGSSDYFERSTVVYSYDSKREVLAVSRESLDEYGSVSEPVAREMAQRARDLAGTTWGVAATGIAGPKGGIPGKPVGTVFIGVAYAADWGTNDSGTEVNRYVFDGSRREIKAQIAHQALEDVLDAVESRRHD